MAFQSRAACCTVVSRLHAKCPEGAWQVGDAPAPLTSKPPCPRLDHFSSSWLRCFSVPCCRVLLPRAGSISKACHGRRVLGCLVLVVRLLPHRHGPGLLVVRDTKHAGVVRRCGVTPRTKSCASQRHDDSISIFDFDASDDCGPDDDRVDPLWRRVVPARVAAAPDDGRLCELILLIMILLRY